MCRYGMSRYKPHFVCVDCRLAAKRRWREEGQPCPACGQEMIDAGFDLAVPGRRDEAGWRALATVLYAGLTFHSCGCDGPGFRPRTPAEVRERRLAAARLGLPVSQTLAARDPWNLRGKGDR